MPVVPVRDGFSFRLGGKVYQSESTTCLYRGADTEAMATLYLMLTKDGRFAYLGRVIGGKGGIHTAEEWSPERAQRYLMEHGEGDVVGEFPDIFRKRVVAPVAEAKPGKVSTESPKGRPAEPYLFPLH